MIGLGALACVPRSPGHAGIERVSEAAPPVFVEAPPLPKRDLFAQLRGEEVDVWIGDDQRLSVRLHRASNFERCCELLAEMRYDIEYFDLAFVPVEDLGALMHVRSTERLDLRGASASLAPLRHLHQLRVLSLAETDFESLAVLAELDELEELDLQGARADLVGVGQLTALRSLDLTAARTTPRGFRIRDGEGLALGPLRLLEQLEHLSLAATKVEDWQPLAQLWTLRSLDLNLTNFQDPSLLADFDRLERIELRRTAIADISLLARLPALRHVDLRDCELVDPADIDALVRQRPELELWW